jgi:hypothetical protein
MADEKKHKDDDKEDSKAGGLLGEAAKKIFTAGVTAAFMTEESVRGYLSEVKLPKELLSLILQGATKSKEELTNRVGKEVVAMIQKIDFVKEASRFAETHKFKITAEIEISKKDEKAGKDKES